MNNRSITVKFAAQEPDINVIMAAQVNKPEWLSIGIDPQVRNAVWHESVIVIVAVIQLAGPTVGEIAKEVLKDAAKEWLVNFIAKLKAKCIRIKGYEPKDETDLIRLISEEIEIGKND